MVLRKKNPDKKLVLATGVFDLFHREHYRFLSLASLRGNLIVGVESDIRVRRLKGVGRPIWNQDKRLKKIQELEFVQFGFVLPENFSLPREHEQLIKIIRPDVLAVSANTPFLTAKQQILNKYGGVVRVVCEHNSKISTTKIVNRKGFSL